MIIRHPICGNLIIPDNRHDMESMLEHYKCRILEVSGDSVNYFQAYIDCLEEGLYIICRRKENV